MQAMNAIDSHYFEFLGHNHNPFYDWQAQIINLGCSLADISLAKDNITLTPEGEKSFSIFVHEYIHFLQNFSTAWGVPIFTDFALALMKIGASSAEDKSILYLPLDESKIKNALLKEGLKMRHTVLERKERYSRILTHLEGILAPIEFIDPNDDYATLTNGRVTVQLGGKVIREHMANLGAQLFLRKSDSDIHTYNETLGGFHKNGIKFSDQPEYWILFEYFYSLGMFDNLAKGIFHLAQMTLITLNPETALLRFINWFQQNKSGFASKLDFVGVVEDWVQSSDELYFFYVGFEQSVKHCQEILDLSKRNLEKHDIFRFTYNIAEYALNNIQRTKGGRLLFSSYDNFEIVDYWKKKVFEFGTGIVSYIDAVLIQGTREHCAKMEESFNFLLSSSLVMKMILGNQRTICPFLEDIPICHAEFKGDENCWRNPFLMVEKNTNGRHCLFANGLLLMGLENRTNFGQ